MVTAGRRGARAAVERVEEPAITVERVLRVQEAGMEGVTLNVEGMSCGHCEAAVEGELNGLPGVERSSADVEKGTVEVSYDEGRASIGDLKAAVAEAGYVVGE